jgi:hypothetical protein
MKYAPLLSIISLLALSACGHSTGDRALSGGDVGSLKPRDQACALALGWI